MRTVIAAKTHTLVSFRNEELIALSNSLNEVLHNSDVDDRDCDTRIGVDMAALKKLHGEIVACIDFERAESTELFEAWKEGYSIQLRVISAFGDPADLSYDEVRLKIESLTSDES